MHQLDESVQCWDDGGVCPTRIDFDQLDEAKEQRITAPKIAPGNFFLVFGADPAIFMLMSDNVVGSRQNLRLQSLIIQGIRQGHKTVEEVGECFIEG